MPCFVKHDKVNISQERLKFVCPPDSGLDGLTISQFSLTQSYPILARTQRASSEGPPARLIRVPECERCER